MRKIHANIFAFPLTARVHLPLTSRRTFFPNPCLRSQADRSGGDGESAGLSYTGESMAPTNPLAKKKLPKVSHRELAPKRGSLGSGSIFDEDEDLPKISTSGRAPQRSRTSAPEGEKKDIEIEPLEKRNRTNIDKVLDPYPNRRARWQRKMVIQSIHRRGRFTKKEEIMRTERESLVKSHWFKTSVKKLNPLARQISGKNIDDAILQMRFSKKKAAIDVKAHLEHAKNEAIVVHGMGLKRNKAREESASDSSSAESTKNPSEAPTIIKLKSGAQKTITDPTSIYISQAWVNRGPYGVDYDHRAHGVINKLRPPYTGLSLVLKEEKTRIREWQDREAKALRQRKSKLWVHLPDRKISAQRQYYSW